jgi:putative flippase GtrA
VVKTFNIFSKFFKAQAASLTATSFDFSITYILTSLFGLSYIYSSATGVVCGGIVNFLLGRYWVFNAGNEKKAKQLTKYLLVWSSSMLLNMGGIIFFTEIIGFYYLISKITTSILVGVFFNYYLQKTFVFRTKKVFNRKYDF